MKEAVKVIQTLHAEEVAKEVERSFPEQLAVEAFEGKVLAEAEKKYPGKHNFSTSELNAIRKQLKEKK